jgi:hypothetical protein
MTSTIKFIGKKTVHCTLFFHIAREARRNKTVEERKKYSTTKECDNEIQKQSRAVYI